MKKYIAGILASFIVVIGVICLFPRGVHAGDPSVNQSDTGVAASASTHDQESAATEKNQQSLISAQPIPSPINYSLERQNLIDKLAFEAKQGTVGYVALIGPMGQLVAYYTIRGKVSSLNSYLTTTQQVQCPNADTGSNWTPDAPCVTIDSPDLDGSYGVNPSGVFFFTTSGQYVEWSGNYLYSDQPMSYVTPPILIAK